MGDISVGLKWEKRSHKQSLQPVFLYIYYNGAHVSIYVGLNDNILKL